MSDETPSRQEALEKINKMMRAAHICMLTTMSPDGHHVSRPMGLQEAEFDGDLWFFTYDDDDKVADIRHNRQVNVSFSDSKRQSWVSLSGPADLVHDRAKAEELWSALLKAYFPDGLETPGLALLRVHGETVRYWDSPSSKAVYLISMVKAAVTGTQPDAGEVNTVTLDPAAAAPDALTALEERPEVIAGIEDDTTVPGLAAPGGAGPDADSVRFRTPPA